MNKKLLKQLKPLLLELSLRQRLVTLKFINELIQSAQEVGFNKEMSQGIVLNTMIGTLHLAFNWSKD